MPSSEPRLDYLDATRAFALILGIIFHAGLSFLPFYIGWAVQDISTSSWVGLFSTISHSFRMELFFLLAGFFSHMTFHRNGPADFLRSRAVRIVGPFVVGWFLLRPLIVSGWIMGGESMRGDYAFWSSIRGGFQQLAQMSEGPLVGTHLWFLYYLILVSLCTLAGRCLVTWSGETAQHTFREKSDRTIAWLGGSAWTFPILVGPIAVTLGFMQGWGVDTPDKSLVPHLPVMLIYGGFFGLGWLLHRQPDAFHAFSRITWGRCLALALGVGCVLVLSPIQGDPGHPQHHVAHRIYNVGYAVMMWTLVWLTIGLFRRLFKRPNAIVRYVADSSYWMYLIHLPVVVWLQVIVAEIELPWVVKWCGVSAATIAISLLTYDLVVRSTWLGAVLNGRRRDRALFRKG